MPSDLTIDYSESGEKVFTVAEYIEILNTFFKARTVRIAGEICELKRAASGHVYFTIKDKDAPGVIDCIMWSRNYQLCGVTLEVGMEVILGGHANIYPPSGRLSFVADTVELVGEGALKKAYEELRKKLEAEGVFAPERKRVLPDYVSHIGIITSMKGAVIHDFQNNLGKFGFTLRVLDSRVEGQQAVKPLLAALRRMRKEAERKDGSAIEALVIIRGGGSLESLQAFNNEALVREVVEFPVPVIAGIGHDQDVPLMALAADYMTSTPTAAAHLLGRSWEEARMKIEQFSRIHIRVGEELRRIRADLAAAIASVLDHAEDGLAGVKERLKYAEQSIKLNNPERQLKLGYAIARKDGKIVRDAAPLRHGDALDIQFAEGAVRSRVDGSTLL
jgi:exodeoxyribonuclease VII large subunit